MAYKFKVIEKFVGFFVVAALLFFIGMIILIGREKKFFEKKTYFYTFYKSGEGLTTGIPVLYNGIKIGQVSTVKLNEDNRIYLKFYVSSEYAGRIHEDSVAQFVKPLLGQSAIRIITPPGSAEKILENDSYIYSSDSEEGQALLASRRNVAEGPERIMANVEELTWLLKDPDGPLFGSLKQIEKLVSTLNEVSKNANAITANVAQNNDRINNILLSLEESADNLATITKNLKHNRLLGGKPAPVVDTPLRQP